MIFAGNFISQKIKINKKPKNTHLIARKVLRDARKNQADPSRGLVENM